MNREYLFKSPRLGFRPFGPGDREAFYRINSHPQVMEFFPRCLDREESDYFHERIVDHYESHGFSLYGVDLLASGDFIGYIGFLWADFRPLYEPFVEIGWRLDQAYWNQGYGQEGARRVLDYGFKDLGLEEVYAFTSQLNKKSAHLMEIIGMEKVGEFMSPRLEPGHPLRPHVLYRKLP